MEWYFILLIYFEVWLFFITSACKLCGASQNECPMSKLPQFSVSMIIFNYMAVTVSCLNISFKLVEF